jgi:hypothetical protein
LLKASPEKIVLIVISLAGLVGQIAFLMAARLDAGRLGHLRIAAALRNQVGPFWFEEWFALLILVVISVILTWSLFTPNSPRTPIGSSGAGVFTGMELYIEACALRRYLRRRDVMNGREKAP